MEKINHKLLNWASILEEKTREQAILTSEMPFIYPFMALMPDAHLGLGATVGSVIPTLGAIMPAAVGVDIGCGMIATRTQWTEDEFVGNGSRPLANLRMMIESVIPLSAGNYNTEVTDTAAERLEYLADRAVDAKFDPSLYVGNWRLQLGTLGSGNHFIEVSVDEEKRVWLFLHSGSRGIGNKIAQKHIKVAQELCRKWWITLPHRDLAYLVEGTPEFWSYIRELRWAQEFALLNREEMMDRVVDAVGVWMGDAVVEQERINCHHNFTTQEKHAGRDVWVSRKGAIEAMEGRWGLIPGSMGDASYVVVGKGNKLSLDSSHGAGRNYSRTAARNKFTEESLETAMKGIEYRHTAAFLDEHPEAYKPIDVVMKDSTDLVEIRHSLHQIVNVKGD